MTTAVGRFTLHLVRVAIGNLKLQDLNVGESRELIASAANLLTS